MIEMSSSFWYLTLYVLLFCRRSFLKSKKAYDAFLAEFPLCYGYWKKYADHEARLGSPEKVVDVYERAVKAVTYSVDMWMNYGIYAMEKFEDPESIRGYVRSFHPPTHLVF